MADGASTMSIEVHNVTKRFGGYHAVENVSLHVPTGELVGLLGPSGSGKTTLLRIIAGLETADAGEITLAGVEVTGQRAAQRRVGFVFQHYALFRHLTVFENVAFGLRVRPRPTRPNEDQVRRRVRELLQLVQLESFADRYPSQLSGGQRQRVALARALAVEPNILLLDEPFGALDARVRKDLRRWLRELHADLHVTTLFVTHDQEEALELSDRVVIMHQGRVEQTGTPEAVYHSPASPFVYHFLGDVNLFHCRVEDGKAYLGGAAVELHGPASAASNGAATVYVRPHLFDITLARTSGQQFRAVVRVVNPAGPLARLELESEWGELVRVELSQERYRALNLRPGSEVYVAPRAEELFLANSGPGH
jgi:sulfate/thiosulfate transport system ATP-binding protein